MPEVHGRGAIREDPIVAEVRATRAQQSARFGHDVWAIYAELK
jgi:hypothetical protein